jgi:cytochrome P450
MKRFEDAPLWPGGRALVGHIPAMRDDVLGLLRAVSRDAGDLVRLQAPGAELGLVTSPDALHDLLVARAKSFEKSPILKTSLEPLAGTGLFTSDGELWRRQRRLMAPLFQHDRLGEYADTMRACAERVVAGFRDGETRDLFKDTTRIAMAVAGKTLFDADTFDDADAIGAAITDGLEWVNEATVSLLMILQLRVKAALDEAGPAAPERLRRLAASLSARLTKPILLPGERSRKLERAIALLDDRVARMIAERRAAGLTRPDLLTHLLAARDEDDGERMTDKQVRDEVVTLFVAGHETTATALAWALHLLAGDEGARRRLRAEVDALGGAPAGFAELPRLPFALQVFKEALRLYPPVYLVGRVAIEDTEIAGHAIERGTVLLYSPFVVHHRADVWPEPDRFDPSRFTPEAETSRHKLAFVPFGAGPRTCIGNHFALMEGPIVLATLVERAELEPAYRGEIVSEGFATLRPKGGVPMRVRLRGGRPMGDQARA